MEEERAGLAAARRGTVCKGTGWVANEDEGRVAFAVPPLHTSAFQRTFLSQFWIKAAKRELLVLLRVARSASERR